MKLVDLAGLAVEASVGAPVVVLREHDEPHRLLPVIVGGVEAAAIAVAVTGEEPPRPLTHDLLALVVESLDGHLEAAEVTALTEGSFVARLRLRGPTGERWLDSRPSDAIALALRLGAPVFVSEAVLDEAGTLPVIEIEQPEIDASDIDEAVESFRSFLDEVDASQFDIDALDDDERDESEDDAGEDDALDDDESDDEASPDEASPDS